MNPYQSGVALGQLIFGGGNSSEATAKGAYLGSRVRDNLDAARLNRAKALVQESMAKYRGQLPTATTQLGLPEGSAAIIGSSPTVDLRNLGALGNPYAVSAYEDAQDASRLGDVARMNRDLAIVHGQPVKTTDIQDHTSFNPYAEPGQEMTPTAVGEATIDKLGALASQYRAGAAKNQAHAHLYDVQADAGGWNPNSGSHKGSKLPSSTTIKGILPATSTDVFATPEQKAAQAAHVQRDIGTVQQWLAAHPGTTLRDYMAQAPVGSPGAIEPTGTMAIPESLQNIHHPQTKADFDALPSGASYIDPKDGQLYRKP